MTPARRRFVGLDFDALGAAAVETALAARAGDAAWAYLVTPNVDHIVRLHDERAADLPAIRRAYARADWCTCDSRVLAILARSRGVALPVVTGSDLTRALLDRAIHAGDRIALVGGSARTEAALAARFQGIALHVHQPPMGLRHDAAAMAAAAKFVADARARFTFLAVGSPQQELLAAAIADRGDATGTGLCIGAAIEFTTGEQRRAPLAMQALGLEWLFRLASAPRRLAHRYLIVGPRIFAIVLADRR